MRRQEVTSPALRALFVIAVSIFFVEMVVMFILSVLPGEHKFTVLGEALLDSLLLIIFVSPLLYYFIFRPLVVQIAERMRVEHELREEKELAGKYFDMAGTIMLVIDPDGKVERINEKGAEILGCSPEAVVGRDWVETFVPGRYKEELKGVTMLILSGDTSLAEHYENPVVTVDGSERTIEWHNTVLRDDAGKIYAMLSSGIDITERKQAEHTLKKARDELEDRVKERTEELSRAKEELEKEFAEHKSADRALVRATRALRTLSDFNGALVRATDEAHLLTDVCRIIVETGGYSKAWIGFARDDEDKSVECAAQRGFPEGYLEGLVISVAEGERGQRPASVALRAGAPSVAKDIRNDKAYEGLREEALREGYASCIAVPFKTEGAMQAVLSIFAAEPDAFDPEELEQLEQLASNLAFGIFSLRLRTERERAQENLLESETKFRSVAQSANEAIISADSGGNIIGWNRGARNIFGHTEEEAVGKPLTILMPERYREDHLKGLERVGRTGESKVVGETLELAGLRKDGSEFPIELSLAAWKTHKGTFYTGIIRDTTERKRIEEEKESIQAQLLHSQRLEAVGRLIVGVAHDFSNIMLSIKGFAGGAKKKLAADDPLKRNLEQIELLVKRGSDVTGQLLLFGRKQPLNVVDLDMNETARSLLKMIGNLIGEEVEVRAELDPGLSLVRADRGNMEQVLMNLVVNASDAMPEGGQLTIKTWNENIGEEEARSLDLKPGDYVKLSVSDTGLGMDEKVAARIFDPFFTTKGNKGSGLGLSVVYGIISRHHGRAEVESEPDKGTVITISLPAIGNVD